MDTYIILTVQTINFLCMQVLTATLVRDRLFMTPFVLRGPGWSVAGSPHVVLGSFKSIVSH